MIDRNLLRFLLVEDDDGHATLIKRSLERERVSNVVDRVDNGEDALLFLLKQPPFENAETPDIILLDLKLPLLDGHEVLDKIKTNDLLKAIPVVVLSTSDAESDRVRAYGSHANSYVVKPLDFTQFRKMVSDLNLYWGVWNATPKIK